MTVEIRCFGSSGSRRSYIVSYFYRSFGGSSDLSFRGRTFGGSRGKIVFF